MQLPRLQLKPPSLLRTTIRHLCYGQQRLPTPFPKMQISCFFFRFWTSSPQFRVWWRVGMPPAGRDASVQCLCGFQQQKLQQDGQLLQTQCFVVWFNASFAYSSYPMHCLPLLQLPPGPPAVGGQRPRTGKGENRNFCWQKDLEICKKDQKLFFRSGWNALIG